MVRCGRTSGCLQDPRPDSQVYTSLRRRADLMMARPVVVCTGFATIGSEDLLTFLEITDPKSKKTDTFRIREGEEFYPGADGKSLLKLIRVVGAQSSRNGVPGLARRNVGNSGPQEQLTVASPAGHPSVPAGPIRDLQAGTQTGSSFFSASPPRYPYPLGK